MGITCNTTSLLPKYLVPPSTAASTYPIFGLSKEQSSHSSPKSYSWKGDVSTLQHKMMDTP